VTDSDAERFALAYASMRLREPWAEKARWRRTRAVADAVELIRRELGARASVVSVGAGVMRLPGVITIDLLPFADVTADMRALPLADGSIDGVLYAASLHYAPVDVAIAEAARVLRREGLFVAIDSPIYTDEAAAAAAKARSESYYASKGFPRLAANYHPIDAGALRAALAANGLELARLSLGGRWRRLLRRGPTSFVLARKLR
jgi:SAM-dependent methyltransferase